MSDLLTVLLDDAVAGVLERRAGGRLRFEYDRAYRARPDATPISVSMPVDVAVHPDGVIEPWLAGLLPEDDRVLARWGRQFHVSTTPFALLGTPVGEDCAGAVRFCREADVDRLLARTGEVDWVDAEWVATRLRDLREDATAWLGRDFTGQFSLAGAQAKTALYRDDSRWAVPGGATPTTHILKPAIRGFDDHELNEHLCLDAARTVGLAVVRTKVERFRDERAIVVARYDRHPTDSGIRRIHQEDLCQALGIPPRRKYQNEGGPSALDAIKLLRRVMPASVAATSVDRFIDALIWNWVIAGTDAHAKNYSLLLAADSVRLAPLYDVASALPYGTHERRLRMAMKIGGDYDLFAVRDRWRSAAIEWAVDPDALVARALALARAAPNAFAEAARAADVVAIGSPGPDRLVSAVALRAERLVRHLS